MIITDAQIENAKSATNYGTSEPCHEHPDCIRLACEWLDAQKKTFSKRNVNLLKHSIEEWCGRYISATDVMVAATLHPDIKGEYPCFNISAKLTLPSKDRLNNIGEAFAHGDKSRRDSVKYTCRE